MCESPDIAWLQNEVARRDGWQEDLGHSEADVCLADLCVEARLE
jgi:hypothetical protein